MFPTNSQIEFPTTKPPRENGKRSPTISGDRALIQQWWRQGRVGTIAPAPTTSVDQTRAYLQAECERLRHAGYEAAIAPIDRNTWHNYRCIVEQDGAEGRILKENAAAVKTRPLFWQEPDLPDYWPLALQQTGFAPIAHYYSAECHDLTQLDPRYGELRDRFVHQGIRLRNADLDRPEPDLKEIYQVAIAAFAQNFLFMPIDWPAFLARYQPLLPWLEPDWILIAEDASGAIVGFVLGLPDRLAPQTPTLILKTVAALPGRQWAGLGRWLVAEFHHRAQQRGYERIIHALMHQMNPSRNLSRRYAQPFRRYALFGQVFNPNS